MERKKCHGFTYKITKNKANQHIEKMNVTDLYFC